MDTNWNQDIELIDEIFPYRVYKNYGVKTPDGGAPLMLIEAGFRKPEDAELYIRTKKNEIGADYVLKTVYDE